MYESAGNDIKKEYIKAIKTVAQIALFLLFSTLLVWKNFVKICGKVATPRAKDIVKKVVVKKLLSFKDILKLFWISTTKFSVFCIDEKIASWGIKLFVNDIVKNIIGVAKEKRIIIYWRI